MTEAIDAFIARWQDADGSEKATSQSFLNELCRLLELPVPDAGGDSYVFERRVDISHPDGSTTRGYIDLYRRGSFVLESKKTDPVPPPRCPISPPNRPRPKRPC